MLRRHVELERADVCQRFCRLETRNIRDRRMRADVDEHLLAREHAFASVVERHLEGLRRNEAARPPDELGAARPVGLEMERRLAFDHVAFAFAHLRHVDRERSRHGAERSRSLGEMRDPRAPDLVLARQACHGRAGAADPLALDDSDAPAFLRQMPGQQLAALAAAKDENVEVFGLGHGILRCDFGGDAGGRRSVHGQRGKNEMRPTRQNKKRRPRGPAQ
jgi:hypothetical protein